MSTTHSGAMPVAFWPSSIDVQDRTASRAVPTTPTVLIIPELVTQDGAIDYDTTTGVISFKRRDSYHHKLMLNVAVTASRNFYAYADLSRGGGAYAPLRYSGRRVEVNGAADGQIIFTSANIFEMGDKIRFYLWAGSAANVVSADLPGTTPGTVTVPAIRLQYA